MGRAVGKGGRAGPPPHPYQRVSPERWLRCRVVAEPSLVGAEHLAPVPALAPADDLRKPRPAPAAGIDREGRPLLAVCSTGFDVDLVPAGGGPPLARRRPPPPLGGASPRGRPHTPRPLVGRLAGPLCSVP